jgi:protein-tyrosine-phosphatase
VAENLNEPLNALFLCTGNSARSIIGEAILNPRGAVHPEAIRLLDRLDYPTVDLRSKSWDEFAKSGAPKLDFVFTVCDNAAAEVCPIWPGQPMTAHWGIPDPAAVEGSDAEIGLAFAGAYRVLHNRIALFASLPIPHLNRLSLQRRLDDIGQMDEGAARI